MTTHQHYIQYHNADNLGYFPTPKTDFKTNIELLRLDNTVKYGVQFYTSKKLLENAVGQFCFLIVGKTEKIKKYYLWSFCKIEDFTKDRKNIYHANGTGFDFQKPILLNDLDNFTDFRNFCGNFGIGFRKIDNHIFCSTLASLTGQPKLNDRHKP